jgi:hypothetical protein
MNHKLLPFALGAILTTVATVGIFSAASGFIQRVFSYHSKPKVEIVAPACKVCHCGKMSCDRECSEENMCLTLCEGLCEKKVTNVK